MRREKKKRNKDILVSIGLHVFIFSTFVYTFVVSVLALVARLVLEFKIRLEFWKI